MLSAVPVEVRAANAEIEVGAPFDLADAGHEHGHIREKPRDDRVGRFGAENGTPDHLGGLLKVREVKGRSWYCTATRPRQQARQRDVARFGQLTGATVRRDQRWGVCDCWGRWGRLVRSGRFFVSVASEQPQNNEQGHAQVYGEEPVHNVNP